MVGRVCGETMMDVPNFWKAIKQPSFLSTSLKCMAVACGVAGLAGMAWGFVEGDGLLVAKTAVMTGESIAVFITAETMRVANQVLGKQPLDSPC